MKKKRFKISDFQNESFKKDVLETDHKLIRPAITKNLFFSSSVVFKEDKKAEIQ